MLCLQHCGMAFLWQGHVGRRSHWRLLVTPRFIVRNDDRCSPSSRIAGHFEMLLSATAHRKPGVQARDSQVGICSSSPSYPTLLSILNSRPIYANLGGMRLAPLQCAGIRGCDGAGPLSELPNQTAVMDNASG
jgi:hypothetical protein